MLSCCSRYARPALGATPSRYFRAQGFRVTSAFAATFLDFSQNTKLTSSSSSGVAVGSSIGHAIGGFFSGGSSEPAPAPQAAAVPAQAAPAAQDQWNAGNCQGAASQFTQCMDDHKGDMQVCNWYLEQLKACQAAAKNY